MSGAHFRIDQASNPDPTGDPDTARVDLWQTQTITFVGDSSGGQASPQWTITAWPEGSARLQPTDASTFTATYSADVPGSYRAELLVDDGLDDNKITFIFAATRNANGIIYDTSLREPAFGEVVGDDNADGVNDRGYAQAIEQTYSAQMPKVDTIAGLTAIMANRHRHVHVLGYYAPGDGGGGVFRWDGASTATHNGGTVIQPGFGSGGDLAVGRWRRQLYGGPLNVLTFGAKGDNIADDTARIQATFNALPSTGGSVYFPTDKIYRLAAGEPALLLDGKNNVKLYSDGPAAIIQLATGVRGLDIANCENVEIFGLMFRGTIQVDGGDPPPGNNYGQTGIRLSSAEQTNIHDCTFLDLGGYAVFPHTGPISINVHHCNVIDTMAGIQAGGGNINKFWVTDCYFRGFVPDGGAGTLAADDMIAAFGSASGSKNGQVFIARNIIDKQGPSAVHQARCIDISDDTTGLSDIQVIDNICLNCITTDTTRDRPAIIIASGPGGLENVRVEGNIIGNCNEGIEISSAGVANLIVDNNIIYDVVRLAGTTIPCAIRVITAAGGTKRGSISNNVVDTTGGLGAGSYAAIDLAALTNFVVAGNVIFDTGDIGLRVTDSTHVTVSNNVIHTTDSAGLVLTTSLDCHASGNIVATTGAHGFQVLSCTSPVVNGNTVRNCTGAGLLVQSNTNPVIVGNNSRGNSLYGLVELSSNTGMIITGNAFQGNTSVGISLQGTSSDGVIYNNRLSGNSAPVLDTSTTSTWIDSPHTWYNAQAVRGTNLGDSSPTITADQGNERVLYAATLTANRTVTLGTGGSPAPATNETITIIRLDTTANTLAVVNGGGGGGTLYTFPASVKRQATFRFDGTDWAMLSVERVVSLN